MQKDNPRMWIGRSQLLGDTIAALPIARYFKKKFPNTRVIIDGTEIPIVKPGNVHDQSATFSTYKNKKAFPVRETLFIRIKEHYFLSMLKTKLKTSPWVSWSRRSRIMIGQTNKNRHFHFIYIDVRDFFFF